MGKYKDDFVIALSQCADEQHKFISIVAQVLRNFDSDAMLRPLRENAEALIRATNTFNKNVQEGGVFEPTDNKGKK